MVENNSDLKNLSDAQRRILGVLIEKQMTTPDHYPLTLNALVTGCNQKTNRDPVMELDVDTVTAALERLRAQRLVWQVKAQGSRSLKYDHNLTERLQISERELAILCLLLLRGAQTPGELRLRTGRMATFQSVSAVEYTLNKLMNHEAGPYAHQLPRAPGQKESRYIHLLGPLERDAIQPAAAIEAVAEPDAAEPDAAGAADPADSSHTRIAALEAAVDELKEELTHLQQQFTDFKQQFE